MVDLGHWQQIPQEMLPKHWMNSAGVTTELGKLTLGCIRLGGGQAESIILQCFRSRGGPSSSERHSLRGVSTPKEVLLFHLVQPLDIYIVLVRHKL